MKKTDFSYLSANKKTTIHATFWEPEQEPVAILQIAHGITEYIDRYRDVAEFFVGKGFVVGGNDHLGHGQSMSRDNPLPGYFGPKGSWKYVEEDVKTCSAKEHLSHMNPAVPVLFISGKEDAVGNFGKGVQNAAGLFKDEQFTDANVKLFEGMRHDVFREKECRAI